MATQIVGGVTVSLAYAPVEETVEEIGDRARAFDGTLRTTVRSRKKKWTQQTALLATADATTLETALNGALPVAVSGDITGSVSTHPEITGKQYVPTGSTYRVVISYTLWES